MRGIPLGVALVAIGLYLVGLGAAPFLDPPEGVHAEIAREMRLAHDWITPRIDGVGYVLISSVDPGRSVVRVLPPASVHLIAQAGGRRLYSNLADRGPDVR